MSEMINKTDDEILDFTQLNRELIVNKLKQNGIPDDPKTLSVMLSALDGMDRAALTKKKIQSDAGLGDKFGIASTAITALLTTMRGDIKGLHVRGERSEVTLPDTLPNVTVVDGELDTTDPNLTYHDVMNEVD